ncbi:MAG: hypothetical protein ACR2PM_15675 [Hyphomicrobiales bacterium]
MAQAREYHDESGQLTVPLRPPAQVMRLDRMGSFFQTRISFMRTLIRRMHREAWRFSTGLFKLDDNGFGRVVYVVHTPHGDFSFVAFSHHLDPEDRTDRVIAERWDATFALVEGHVDEADLDRLETNVPLQEAGRCSARELVLSRANKSVRLFDYVARCLAGGTQPDISELAKIGYLMRTTAVYGNGKFGLGDFPKLHKGPVLNAPFQAEMLTVFMIRHFAVALVEHVARMRSRDTAVPLAAAQRRILGIGNATGLGMAPFLIKHPILIHKWLHARETALARVRSIAQADAATRVRFSELLDRAAAHVAQWNVEDERQQDRIVTLRAELDALRSRYSKDPGEVLPDHMPWDSLYRLIETHCTLEAQELTVSLLLELYPDVVDDLTDRMASDEIEAIDPAMRLSELKDIIEQDYDWALGIDFSAPRSQHYFWYYSEGKEEPRRGPRFEEPGAECEMRLGFGREISALHGALAALDAGALDQLTAEFLLANPQWRAAARRVQTLHRFPYGEVRNNLLADDCLPIDLLRCKLSFFGATKWDPKSDLWTRITLYQGAPHIDELGDAAVDDWAFPVAQGGGAEE